MAPEYSQRQPEPSTLRHAVAGVIAITAVWLYCVFFTRTTLAANTAGAGFPGLLELALGAGGISGSLLAAKCFSPGNVRVPLILGYLGCALSALASLGAHGATPAGACGFAAGACLGWTSVLLALCLRPSVHLRRLGICCGLGVGIAYAISCQPALQISSPMTQTLVCAGFCIVGALTSLLLRGEPNRPSASFEYRRPTITAWVAIFLGMVWIDSAAVYVIQHHSFYAPGTWDFSVALQGSAFIHICAAALAGVALNRHQLALTVSTGLFLLLCSCLFLDNSHDYFPAARAFHTASVSVYAAAFFFYAARSGRRWIAGLVFAVSGWVGLSGGRSMATALHSVPTVFVVSVVSVSVAALLGRYYWIRAIKDPMGIDPRLS